MDSILKITVYTMQNTQNLSLISNKKITKDKKNTKEKKDLYKSLLKKYEGLLIENKLLILESKFFKEQFIQSEQKLKQSDNRFKLVTAKTIIQDEEDEIQKNKLLDDLIQNDNNSNNTVIIRPQSLQFKNQKIIFSQ